MTIVHQGISPADAAIAGAQRSACGDANHPSSIDIERILRADRIGATWREVSR